MKQYLFTIFSVVIFFNPVMMSQVIHKNDIKYFVGVLKTTPLNEPQKRITTKYMVKKSTPSTFEPNKPLSSHFVTFAITTQIDSMEKRYPHTLDSSSTYSIVRYPENEDLQFQLSIRQKSLCLILYHNGMFEGGTSYLTLWREKGDRLTFVKLFPTPFRVGTGYTSFPGDYVINKNRDLIFVTLDANSDNLSSISTYRFHYFDKDYNLTELLNRTFYANFETRHQSNIMYKFLDMRTLLIQKYDFSYDEYEEDHYYFMDRKLRSSTFELLNLKQIYDEIKQQK